MKRDGMMEIWKDGKMEDREERGNTHTRKNAQKDK